MKVKILKSRYQPKWLRERHKNWHANRPRAFFVKVEGCQECLLEIIWKQNRDVVLRICEFHDQVNPNLLKNEYHLAFGGWFKACSHCIDTVFIAWSATQEMSLAP